MKIQKVFILKRKPSLLATQLTSINLRKRSALPGLHFQASVYFS